MIIARTGLIFATNLSKIPVILGDVCKHVTQTLYISLTDDTVSSFSCGSEINGIYQQATKVCNELDIRLLIGNIKNPNLKNKISTINPIDLVIFDTHHTNTQDAKDFAISNILKLQQNFTTLKISDIVRNMPENLNLPNVDKQDKKLYDYAALGGTFDRLHNGHKILLSEGIIRTRKGLTVGVTDLNMIKSKKLWELIEPLNIRIEKLKEFLHDVDPTLEYNVVPIQDVYGPTKDDPKLELLIVSRETVKGGEMVNAKRKENKLNPLFVHCIELADDSQHSIPEEEAKVSSSNKRMRVLGTLIKKPKENPNLDPSPYIIGITGGIASGKTNITKKLSELGAGIINCDLIAHELYKPGKPMNSTIAAVFGSDIINSDGEVNRKKLGDIVFNDPSRLIELNNLLWPAIMEEAKARIKELGKQGYEIVVMEAAVLIQAGWQNNCHQVWTSIVPPDEAVKRIIERNGLSEKAARDRLSMQPSNTEQVSNANVVFSSLWSYEFTSMQVERAWENLIKYLRNKSKM